MKKYSGYILLFLIVHINISHAMNDNNTDVELNNIDLKIDDKIAYPNKVDNVMLIKNNISDHSINERSKYMNIISRSREIIINDIYQISQSKIKKYKPAVTVPEKSLESHSKSEKRILTKRQKFTKDVIVPINTLEIRTKCDENMCAICYHKFSYFSWQQNAKGTLKIKTDNKNHHIHCKILCKKCITYMVQMKGNCPYCREPIDIPENVNKTSFTLSTKRKIGKQISNLFKSMNDSCLCECIKTILMIPLFLIMSPFILLYSFGRQFMIFKDDNQETRGCVQIKRLMFIILLFLIFLEKSRENAGEN